MLPEERGRWARAMAGKWWEARWDATRPPLNEIIEEAYLLGAIDALREHTREIREGV